MRVRTTGMSGHARRAVTVRLAGSAAALMLLAACTSGGAPQPSTTAPVQAGTEGASGTSVGACPAAPAYTRPPAERPHYDLTIRVDPPHNLVTGTESVQFTPDIPTDRLVFRLWPNAPPQAAEGAHLAVQRVTGASVARTEQPEPTTLLVFPRGGLVAGQAVTVSMQWHLTVPGAVLDRLARDGDTVRLGSFYPILAWQPGVGWATDPPTTILGEASTSPTADYDVAIRAPKGLVVVATGQPTGEGRWRAEAVRDFALAVGPFHMASHLVYLPDGVRVTVAVQDGVSIGPDALLQRVDNTLGALRFRYGPYPWPSFSLVVTRDLNRSGIEYPNLVFEGSNGILRVTTHELGHQWFYSLVGNDQGRDPWLDEALATWAAARVDHFLGFMKGIGYRGLLRDHVGFPMTYWDGHQEHYEDGVYFRGVQALAALGPPALVDCALRLYVASNAYGIATPADFGAAVQQVIPDAARKLAPFGITL